MAVVAFRRLGISQLGDFAVIGIEVGLGNLAVTTPAGGHDVELEPILVGAANGVRSVAVVADRQRLVGLGHFRRMDALYKLLLDPVVTGAARRGNVFRIDS